MSLRRFIPVLVVVGLYAAGILAQEQFTLLATIVDPEKGTPVESLTAADVKVAEDGQPAKVLKVEAVVRQVKVQLLIDNGIGVGQNSLSDFRTGVRNLIGALPPDIETTIMTTAPQARTLVKATKSRDELLKGVDRLAPDTGTGRFVESLGEAIARASKEKDTFTVIICAGTTSGDGNILPADMKRVVEPLQGGRPILIHVLLYSGVQSALGGDIQIELGQQVTKMTGGRYEYINNMNRYVTLMPELGAEVAKQAIGSAKQFRITAQRPEGRKGAFVKLSISVGARVVSNVRVE